MFGQVSPILCHFHIPRPHRHYCFRSCLRRNSYSN